MKAVEDDIPGGFEEDIQAFIAYLELERGLSSNTTEAYLKDLAQCAAALDARGVGDWKSVEEEDVTFWVSSLTLGDYAVSSLSRKLSAVRMLAKFLVREKRIASDFTALIASPKRVRRLPGTLSVGEVDRLLGAPDIKTAHGLRDKAILELMYSSGLRVSELSGVTLQAIDLEHGFLRVFGKGSKERGVPIGSEATKALQAYLEYGRPKLMKPKTGSELFISQWGRAISRKTVWLMIKTYAKAAGIEKNVKPHLLRHSFATHLLSNGAHLRAIQEMLGHVDISTTEVYTAVNTTQLVDAHEAYHPRSG